MGDISMSMNMHGKRNVYENKSLICVSEVWWDMMLVERRRHRFTSNSNQNLILDLSCAMFLMSDRPEVLNAGINSSLINTCISAGTSSFQR